MICKKIDWLQNVNMPIGQTLVVEVLRVWIDYAAIDGTSGKYVVQTIICWYDPVNKTHWFLESSVF